LGPLGCATFGQQLLEKMLAGIGATHAAKLQAICQHNLTASGKEFSAPIGAAALVSMVRRDHAARKMAEMQRLYNNRFKCVDGPSPAVPLTVPLGAADPVSRHLCQCHTSRPRRQITPARLSSPASCCFIALILGT
jgi:hypothetical protein